MKRKRKQAAPKVRTWAFTCGDCSAAIGSACIFDPASVRNADRPTLITLGKMFVAGLIVHQSRAAQLEAAHVAQADNAKVA